MSVYVASNPSLNGQGPTAGTPEWWLDKLSLELQSRQQHMWKMDRYYRGKHPLPFLTRSHEQKMRNEFSMLLQQSRSNFCRLVIDAVEERLRVDGIRLSASSSSATDQGAWDIWQANNMDSESQSVMIEALAMGVSYLSVWEGEGDYAHICAEDPRQTIVGYEPGSNFRRRASALKIWRDDWDGAERANVYMPDAIYKFRAKSPTPVNQWRETRADQKVDRVPFGQRWEAIGEPVPNVVGVVPIVPLRNRPRLLEEGESELADITGIQDQINGFLFLLALAGYFGAHRQRWATGIKLMEDENGKLKEPFDTAIDKLWVSEDPAAKMGDLEATPLDGYIAAIEQKILHIAVTTRTPRHYLIEQGQSPSGDAIQSAESGLVKKVLRKQRPFGEGFEEAIRLARLFQGEGDTPVDSEIVWADAEVQSVAQITDAAIKRFLTGIITWRQCMEDCGYSAVQIERMLKDFGGVAPTPQFATTTAVSG